MKRKWRHNLFISQSLYYSPKYRLQMAVAIIGDPIMTVGLASYSSGIAPSTIRYWVQKVELLGSRKALTHWKKVLKDKS